MSLGFVVKLTKRFIVDMYHVWTDHIQIKEKKGSKNALKAQGSQPASILLQECFVVERMSIAVGK